MPLLDGFRGADTTWAIHWPGAPLFYSCLAPLLRDQPWAYPLIFMGLWMGLAVVSREVARRFTTSPVVLWSVAAAVLLDRAMLGIAGDRRPELLAALCVMGWLLAVDRCHRHRASVLHLACVAFLALAASLCHPVTMACMGGLALLGLAGLLMKRLPVPLVLAHCLGGVAGAAVFAGRIFWLPHGVEQFMDHVAMNRGTGMHFNLWAAAVQSYHPSPSGIIGVFLASIYGAWILCRRSHHLPDLFLPRVAACTYFGLLASCHLFANSDYIAITSPLACVLSLAACSQAAQWLNSQWKLSTGAAFATAAAIFIGGNAACWAHKGRYFWRVGCPDLTGEINQWYATLPADARRVLIPDHLWEAGAMDTRRSVAFVTPPYSVSDNIRLAYEQRVLAELAPGDLVVVDSSAKDSLPRLQPWLAEKWPLIARHERSLPTSNAAFWGHRFELYRKP